MSSDREADVENGSTHAHKHIDANWKHFFALNDTNHGQPAAAGKGAGALYRSKTKNMQEGGLRRTHARRQPSQGASAHCSETLGGAALRFADGYEGASIAIHAPSGREESVLMGSMFARHASVLSRPLRVRLLRRSLCPSAAITMKRQVRFRIQAWRLRDMALRVAT